MAFANGTVTKIYVKEKPEPDNYGNTHRYAIKVDDGEWIGLGDGKGPKLTVPVKGKEYRELTEGSVVEFLYTEKPGNNGNVFRDGKRSGIKVLEWAAAQPSTATTPRPATSVAATPSTAPTRASSPPDWARKDAGAAASASIDKAIAYLTVAGGLQQGDHASRMATIKNVARDMQAAVVELANEIIALAGVPKIAPTPPVPQPTTSKPAAKAAPAKATKAEEAIATQRDSWEEDDQVPF